MSLNLDFKPSDHRTVESVDEGILNYIYRVGEDASQIYDVNYNAFGRKEKKSKDQSTSRITSSLSSPSVAVSQAGSIATGPKYSEAWEEIMKKLKSSFESKWNTPMQNNARLEDFRLTRTLGAGSFGRVILVKHLETEAYYAMKLLIKEKVVKTKQVEHTLNEKRILQAMDFPNLVNLVYCFKDPSNLYLVLGFENGGELFTHLRKSRRFPEPMTKFYCAQVVLAFEYLHSLDIIYRDLKPENMLICASGYTKVTDLGFAKRLGSEMRTYTLCGTPEYLAPEVIKHRGYGKSVDWWTVGVLIYEMAAGNVPFHCKEHSEMYSRIVKGNFKCPDFFSKELVEILTAILQTDTSKRFGCLRGGPNDIKNHKWFSGLNWESIYHQTIRPSYIPEVKGPGDTRHFQAQQNEEHIHISGVDKYGSLFKEF